MDDLTANSSWCEGETFNRFITDLVVGEVKKLRPNAAIDSEAAPRLSFGPDGIDLDSLEHLRLAAAISGALRLGQPIESDPLLRTKTLREWISECRRLVDPHGVLSFSTSGSTMSPRNIQHSLAGLEEEAAMLAAILPLPSRVVALIPSHHIYGFLFTILLPRRLGVPVLDARALSIAALASKIAPKDLLIGVPSLWQAQLDAGAVFPQGAMGVTSGGPCPSELWRGIRARLDYFIEIYGSTETGGVGWREDGDSPYRLLPCWRRVDDNRIAKGEAVFDLPDEAAWEGDDLLRPLRRHDGAVQIGGVNVYPQRVREHLLAHPLVRDAQVRLMRPDEGERLKAFIVPADLTLSHPAMIATLEAWLAERLSVFERPRAYTFGAGLPVNAMGKSADWEISPQARS